MSFLLRSRPTTASALLFSFVVVSAGLASAQGDDPAKGWMQWRGPSRDSKVAAEWPAELSEANLKLLWKKPLGPSYSGPVIVQDTVFTTETKDKRDEVVTALDSKTGEVKWTQQWPAAMSVPFFAAKNGSWIRATPASDGERLYVAGMTGRLVCLDRETGKEIWSIDFSKRYGTKRESFGHVCSPLIVPEDNDNALYVQCSAGFLKLNRLTGKEIWRTLQDNGNIMSSGAFSSPIVATLDGVRQLVVQTRTKLAGVDMKSGYVLWSQEVPAFRGMNILTPTVVGNQVFTSTYNNKSYGFEIQKNGDSFVANQKWSSPVRAYMSSPVLIDGHAYLHLQNRQIACFDVKTGENKWVSKNRKRFGEYWSMVANGDRILALDSSGVLYLMKANPEKFEVLGSVDLETSNSWAHLAVDGDKVYVRGIKGLYAYQWK